MEKARIGVVGLGSVAQLVHLPNLSKINNAEITAVSEIKSSRLNAIAEKFGVKAKYRDHLEMLEKSELDAVIIATPTSTHKDIALDCIKAGKDILIEKPMARSFVEAKQIVDAAKKANVKLMVGMNLRFRPDIMLLRSLINSGEIGSTYYVRAGWIRQQSSTEKWFTKKEESGGGVITDLGIHLIDLSLWLLGYPQVESVSAKNFFHNTKSVEDTSISFIRCKNSSVISLESSWSLPVEKDHFYLNLYGTKGSYSSNPFRVYKKMVENYMDLTPSQSDNTATLFKKSYMNELKSFIGAVKGLNPVFSPGEESMERMKIIEAMYKSASENMEVKF